MARTRPLAAVSRILIAAVLAAGFVTAVGPVAHPGGVAARTAYSMEAAMLAAINHERAKRGLTALRASSKLADLAGGRASAMASLGVMEHSSCLSCSLNARGIQRYGAGEVIAYNNYPWGTQSAAAVVSGWMGSPSHRDMLMSSTLNYIGIGVAYRGANHGTYAAAVLTESKDQTKPSARMRGSSRNGTTVSWAWAGADLKLQTHTTGLKNFDVQYRVDSGSWSTIRTGTTATSLSLSSRAQGRCYSLRVRARDNMGNTSAYTSAVKVCVPLGSHRSASHRTLRHRA